MQLKHYALLPLLLVPTLGARAVAPVAATAVSPSARSTLSVDPDNRLTTPRGKLKLDLREVAFIAPEGAGVRVHFLDGDVASGVLRDPILPAGADRLYLGQAPPELQASPPETPMVAWVNGTGVPLSALEAAASRAREGQTRRALVQELVDKELLFQAALERGTLEEPKVKAVMVNTLLRSEVYGQVRNSDFEEAELRAYFEAHREDFVVPEKLQIWTITWLAESEESDPLVLCEAARLEVMRGADFQAMAKAQSVDAWARRGGDAGYVSREGKPGLAPEIVQAAFTLEEHAPPVCTSTDEGAVLVHVNQRREEVERSFEQLRGTVLRQVKNAHLQELYDMYVHDLAQGADVQLNTALIEGAALPEPARQTPAGNLEPTGLIGSDPSQ